MKYIANRKVLINSTMNDKGETIIPTLKDTFNSWITDYRGIREGTKLAYTNAFARSAEFHNTPVDKIKFSDLRHMYVVMLYDKGYSYSSVELLNSVLMPVFESAVRDGYIKDNPARNALKEASRGYNRHKKLRNGIDDRTQTLFLNYIREHKRFSQWENFFIFMFGTGCRIGEAIGLKWSDVFFKEKYIHIQRSLTYRNGKFIDGPTKTQAGNRKIPINENVEAALVKIYNQHFESDYVFVNSRLKPLYPSMVNIVIRRIIDCINIETNSSLEYFSVHQIRHTFCRHLCEKNLNIKIIQQVMGHSNYSTTMDIYAEISDEKITEAFENLNL